MRDHRRNLQRRSRLLSCCRKWTVGFGGWRPCSFQRKRLPLLKRRRQHSTWTPGSWKRLKPCGTKGLVRNWVPEVFLNADACACAEKGTFLEAVPWRTFPRCRAKGPFLLAESLASSKPFQRELLHRGHRGSQTQTDSKLCPGKQYRPEVNSAAVGVTEVSLAHGAGLSHNGRSHGVIVLNNSRRKCCCQGPEPSGTRGLLTTRGRPPFKLCPLQSRSPFMMYKKLSMVKLRVRILKCRSKFWRGKACRSSKNKLSWVEKVARDRRDEDLALEAFAGGSCPFFPPWRSDSSSPRNPPSWSDMNNLMPGPLVEESRTRLPEASLGRDGSSQRSEVRYKDLASRDQNGVAELCVPQSLRAASCGLEVAAHKEEMGEAPSSLDGCPGDVVISVSEKEISVSGPDDGDSHGVMGADELVLEPCKTNPGPPDSFANGPGSAELVQNEDSCSQMEVEGPGSADVFGAELLDHPYCKSPLDEPRRESTGQKPGTQKSGKRSSQRASCVSDEQLAVWLCGFLDEVMKKYGSLVPLCEKDVMGRLKEVFNEDFSHRKPFITKEIMKYQTRHPKSSTCSFRVFYNKHMLDMDDLTTLDGQNWLNDQIINMYGELIMDAVPEKVHFFNSFFHRQLVTKGYNGVKRWTKKVDLFKKTLLLIPIHLEVHWSLITVNLPNRIISFYDSQGIHFKFCVENIRKYLLTEAKEKNQPEFLQGWQTAVTKCIPQQKNDSDCGVFVLQYCKCLALDQPFQFSQEDMPRVRKRIYKELCECRLID
ncbi:sentrin-specific protease 5 [Paroedura picta]|uniref:sentrin-specific protease 5 n=1 Tax=Paroedura picta TaxID=143630 RepID=UPI00405604D9